MQDRDQLDALLAAVAAGDISPALARQRMEQEYQVDLGFARFDVARERRTGVPEVIFAAGKSKEQLLELIEASLARHGRVLATRVDDAQGELAAERFHEVRYLREAGLLSTEDPTPSLPRVAVLSAGTSDQRVAEEAAGVLGYLGHEVDRIYDVGVAGIHRLFAVLDRMALARVLVVVAGMEGALPSVVAGLTHRPVVAVPTSVGYGASFGGVAALLAMLNSCAAGVAVVNIDNGFGAAMFANRVAREIRENAPAGPETPESSHE